MVAFAQPASPLQFIRLHRLDNVVVPIVHPATDGARPVAGVVQARDGQFYGTTICGGGTFDCFGAGAGTVFRLDAVASVTDGSAFMVLHAFSGGADGGSPYAPLIQAANGLLYGTTICGGGSADCFAADPTRVGHGTIFSIDPASGAFTTLHAFQGTDGTSPYGALVQGRDGNLYGTTFCGGGATDCNSQQGGPYGGGTIFRFNPTTGVVTTLHAFSDSDVGGCSSLAALVEDKTTSGVFYGTMAWCGANGGGTVFKIDVSKNPNTNLSVVYAFTGAADGASPAAPLLIALDGSLYGTAEYGGFADGDGFGTVFKLNTNGTGFTTLHTFAGGLDGGNPYAGVVQPHDGTLYGTSFYLSTQAGTGTIFRLDPGTRQFETLYTFTGGFDGQNPAGALVQMNESLAPGFTGSLVGTTLLGPTTYGPTGAVTGDGDGIIFRYVPPPLLLCPASVVTSAVSPAGASVTLSTILIDPANTATTISWSIDGTLAQVDFVPAASSAATSTRTTKSLTASYTAGTAGTPASIHSVTIKSVDALGLTSSCALTVEVDKLDQVITVASVPAQTYRNPNGTVTLSATSSSGLPVTFALVSGPASLAGATLTITGAGTVVVQASQAGNGQYNPAPDVPRTITVNKASQTITFAVIANQTFANPPPSLSLTPTADSGLPVTLTATGPATLTLTQTAPVTYSLTLTGAGTVTVTASQAGDSNYNAATNVPRPFAVAKASQIITFPTVAPQTVGNPSVTLAATATSGLAITYSLTGPGTILGNVLTVTGAGTIAITASQAGDINYNAATSVRQTVVVKANQTITFPAPPPQVFGNPPVALNATASSGLAVTYTVVSGPGSISGNLLTIAGAGAITVSAAQSGNATYNAAAVVQQTVAVARATQTIAFPAVPTQFVGFPPVTLAATASSGLPVSYTASGPGTVSGNVLTITGAGTIVVTASQPGDGNYNAAVPVQQNITVLDASQSPLNRFVAFSSDSTWLHAGTVVATGDVGANDQHVRGNGDDDDDDDGRGTGPQGHGRWHSDDPRGGVLSQITVRLDMGVVMQQASSRVVGDTVLLLPGAKIYNLIDNHLINIGGTILGTRVDSMPIPYLTMPAFPAITVGTRAITVKKNTTMTLAAGNYGRVSVESGATLKLSGGLYQFVSLDVDHDATVLFQAAVQLRIQTSLDADSAAKLILDPVATGLRASQVVIYVWGANDGCANDRNDSFDKGFGGAAVVNIGERAIIQANVYAPNGSIWLKSRSQATGAFIGRHVFVGTFSRLTLDSAFF